MPPSHGGDQGFESPTGYQKPLTTIGWFFAFYLLFKGTNKTTAQAEAGVRIPYGLSEATHNHWVVFCFLFAFQGNPQNESASRSRGSNPLLAIRSHSQPLGGFLLFICFSREPTKRQRTQKHGFESPTGYQRPLGPRVLATKCSYCSIHILMDSNNLRESYQIKHHHHTLLHRADLEITTACREVPNTGQNCSQPA